MNLFYDQSAKISFQECLKNNPQAVVQIMSSHGDIESLLYFSDLMKGVDLYLFRVFNRSELNNF